jgi:polar amino acid transport system substrate-binding protein
VKARISAAIFPTTLHLKLRHDGELPQNFRARALPDCPPNPVGMYFSRALPEPQRQRLTAALRRMVRSGEVQRIYARFLGDEATRQMFETGRAAAGGLAV